MDTRAFASKTTSYKIMKYCLRSKKRSGFEKIKVDAIRPLKTPTSSKAHISDRDRRSVLTAGKRDALYGDHAGEV